MVEFLNYLQEKDKMIREFKFFHGITIQTEGIQGIVRTLRAQWRPELVDDLNYYHNIDAEAELTRLMSEQIAEEIDNEIMEQIRGFDNDEILNEITRRINGGQRA
jgi:Major capsid protein Gp23